ncbi:MAG: hypothetical protein HGB11_00015 [Chlorobiales bacterium]|nr:hypothetical protein [Chlorobiales bacterium]
MLSRLLQPKEIGWGEEKVFYIPQRFSAFSALSNHHLQLHQKNAFPQCQSEILALLRGAEKKIQLGKTYRENEVNLLRNNSGISHN